MCICLRVVEAISLLPHFHLLLARDAGDLGEGQLQQDLLLIIHHIDTGPVDSDNDIILRQIRT